MSSLNKVMLIGRLTRDPQLRHTPRGTALAEFGLALNRSFITESGEKREDPTFVDISVWGRTAESIGKHLRKGSLAYVEGRLQMDIWVDKTTGKNRSKLTIVGESVQFLQPASSSRHPPSSLKKCGTSPIATAPSVSDAAGDDWNEPF